MGLQRFLVLLLLAPALLAPSVRQAWASAPVLTAPRAGDELRAGSLATVAWEGLPAEAEEWEAFLSVDGGRTYPMRITPHLDLSIRRFSFKVPAFPTGEGRILLRFGDEHREVEVETPQRFAIVAGDGLPGEDVWPVGLQRTLSRGEKSRPDEAGVVVWVEGARDGSGLREVVAEEKICTVGSVETSPLPWIPLLWPARHRDGFAPPATASEPAQTPLAGPLETGPVATPPVLTSVRLLTGRRNE